MNFVQPIRDQETIDDIKSYLRNKNERNYILFMIGISTGLRISDILPLKAKDLRGEYISVKEQKTNKRKRVIITTLLKRELKVYLSDKDDDEYVIKSQKGTNKPIGRSTAYRILRDAADQFGLDDIGTHTMRKTFGYAIYNQTKDVALLQKIFNHSNPAITLRYIGVDQDRMDHAMMKLKI